MMGRGPVTPARVGVTRLEEGNAELREGTLSIVTVEILGLLFKTAGSRQVLFALRETLFLSSKMFIILTFLKRQSGKTRAVPYLQKHLDNYCPPIERALGLTLPGFEYHLYF